MAADLFVYGILMFPEIVHAITGCHYRMDDAVLPGHARYGLPHDDGQVFAAIAPHAGSSVPGKLIRQVSCGHLALFDRVEEIDAGYYERRMVAVCVNGDSAPAWAYCAGASRRHALTGDWDPAGFDADSIRRFIEHDLPRYRTGR